MTRRRVLFVSREPIFQLLGGSATYAINILRQLIAADCDVLLLVTQSCSRSPRPWFVLRCAVPAGVKYRVPGMACAGKFYFNIFSVRPWARALLRLASRSPLPPQLQQYLHKKYTGSVSEFAWDLSTPTAAEMALVDETVAGYKPDVVITNYAYWAPIFARPAVASARKVVLMHDLLSARAAGMTAAGLVLDCMPLSAATEFGWLAQADCLLAAQRREADLVQERVHGLVLVPPVLFTPHAQAGAKRLNHCFFVGSRILPNVTGLAWFLENVWPLVRAKNPAATLAIAGSICEVTESGLPGVELLGIVPAVETAYADAAVCIVPLRVGSGIKIKLLEALAHGKAVVSTTIGVQGLEEWTDGTLAVADEPADFAAAVLRVCSDEAFRSALEQGGRRLLAEHFSERAPSARDFVARLMGDAPMHDKPMGDAPMHESNTQPG